MPSTWQDALDAYQYPVDLSKFSDAENHPGWFVHSTGDGGRSETAEFEERFRRYGPNHLEAWYEVVFWKLYSQPNNRNRHTRNVIERLTQGTTASELWKLTQDYIEHPNRGTFQTLREEFFPTEVVATVATFPAFVCPEKFPMIDKHVTNWARANGPTHSYAAVDGPEIVEVPELGPNQTVVMEKNWGYVSSWVEWCQFTANLLTKATGCHWRARDVEMAVFAAQCGHLPLRPLIDLARDVQPLAP